MVLMANRLAIGPVMQTLSAGHIRGKSEFKRRASFLINLFTQVAIVLELALVLSPACEINHYFLGHQSKGCGIEN
jgi:hypothetical protein